MNEDVAKWEFALTQADALLDTDWRVDHDVPGWLYKHGNRDVRKEIPLDVWYLRRAMTIGRGWGVQQREGK